MLVAIAGVVIFVFIYRLATRVDEKITDKRIAQQRLDDGVHWQEVDGDSEWRTITTVDFDKMTLSFRNVVNDYPGSDTTTYYDVRRLDGPVWQTKLSYASMKEAMVELEKEPTDIMADSLKERIEQAKDWATVKQQAPKWETAYQKHIHRR